MRLSHYFMPTLREVPAEADVVSHVLLLRGGFIRQLAAGVYSHLPLAQCALLRIRQIIREEMNRIGGQEFHLPAIHPAEVWQATGRWEVMGDNMFRLKDRWGRDMCLGMTHEEVFTSIARNELRSYRQLPQIWYQIQTKFRDEPRPKSGLLRVREFTMKDSYSFDVDRDGLDTSYRLHYHAYCRIYARCGLDYFAVEAHSGSMGGSQSHEFMVRSDAGEDLVARCAACGYAANLEKATNRLAPVADTEPAGPEPVRVATPGQKTIEEISNFLGVPAQNQIKTLVYMVDSQPMLILMRGDHQLNEAKLEAATGTSLLRPATAEEIVAAMGADAGSLGPVGVQHLTILADEALRGRRNMTTGANATDFHIQGVTPDVHFTAAYHDLRTVADGDLCPGCGAALGVFKSIEVGHIFKLGTKYSDALGATVLNRDGQSVPIVMGSYGIGAERILSAAVEQCHDDKGIVFPATIAPFDVILVPVSMEDSRLVETADRFYAELRAAGLEVLYDDRPERPGVKFNDADLVGIPVRITLGTKKLAQGLAEVTVRREAKAVDCPVGEVTDRVTATLAALRAEIEARVRDIRPLQ
ncbi:MAG: proline--tRNA ligase [Acidobacteria bacterium]|nr:proline--tRNA ligase [Acidobacteriota bacterium]